MTSKQTKKVIGLTLLMTIFSSIFLTVTVFAQEWLPRTTEEIKTDLKHDAAGFSAYTIKWGDTLDAISLATDVSVEQLVSVNNIDNIRLIHTGNTIYFNADKTVITLANRQDKRISVQSFNMVNGEEVTTPQQTIKKIEEVTQTQQPKLEQTTSVMQQSVAHLDVKLENNQTVEAVSEPVIPTLPAESSSSPYLYSLNELMYTGIIYWEQYKFTYYSQSVLPGGGLYIPGRHVNDMGYVADEDGYIVLANSAPLGTIIDTPFGVQGKVYDRGTTGNHFDVYIQ